MMAMKRRALPATVATAIAEATAGCGFRLSGSSERQRFAICDGDCDWASHTPEPGADPIVERHRDENCVLVYGKVYVGSSSCDRAVLESVGVSRGTLRVEVGVWEKGLLPNVGCTAEMGPDRYRASFTFRESLPERVVVEERAAWDPSDTPSDGGRTTATDGLLATRRLTRRSTVPSCETPLESLPV